MSKKVVIFGIGDFAQVADVYLTEDSPHEVVAFTVNQKYVLETLDDLHRLSLKGFAFNALTSYSDPEHIRDDLFYADPSWLFDHCKRSYSGQVALLHDYGLYEFTILVRKNLE